MNSHSASPEPGTLPLSETESVSGEPHHSTATFGPASLHLNAHDDLNPSTPENSQSPTFATSYGHILFNFIIENHFSIDNAKAKAKGRSCRDNPLFLARVIPTEEGSIFRNLKADNIAALQAAQQKNDNISQNNPPICLPVVKR